MLQLPQRLGLNLTDALAGHRELLADFLQGVVGVHADAEAHAQDAFLARGERGQHSGRGLAQVRLDRGVDRQHRVLVLNEIAEVRILLVADRGFERDRFLGDFQALAYLLDGHVELPGKLLGRRFAADLVEHLPACANDFVDHFDHVHGDADGARLIGERAADRLPDPPRRVGRELVAAAVLELVDRLHQADVALLNQVEELQAAVGVFLRDRDDEAQIGLHHLLLGLARFALALLHHMDDLAEFLDLEAGLARQLVDVGAQVLYAILVAGNEVLPALGGELGNAVEPARIELRAEIVLEEILAYDAVAFGKPHHAALIADQALVDVVELLDQRIDARLIEPQRFHLGDDLVLELLVLALLGGRQRLVSEPVLDVLVLQAAQPLVAVGDVVEGLKHLGLELSLDGRKRHGVLKIVFVELALGRIDRLRFARQNLGLGAKRHGGGGCGRLGRLRRRTVGGRAIAGRYGRHGLGVRARIGGFQVDDVAQEYPAVVEFVPPDDDGLEGERALAQTSDHRLAAGFNTFCDRDFALARQQLDRAHFAQIHAYGIVGALAGLRFLGLRRGRAPHFHEFAVAFFPFGFLLRVLRRLLGLGFLRFDDVDPHLTEHHQDVLDLLGLDLLRGQQRVDLVVGDVAALLGATDQLIDGIVPEVDRRAVGRGLGAVLLRNLILLFRCIGVPCGTLERRDELAPLHSITSSGLQHSPEIMEYRRASRLHAADWSSKLSSDSTSRGSFPAAFDKS